MGSKYEQQRAFREALQTGVLTSEALKSQDDLEALLSALYPENSLFIWFREFWEDFKTGISRRGTERSEGTINQTRKEFRRFADWCVDTGLATCRVDEITDKDLRAYLDTFKTTPRSWRKYYSHIRQLFNFMMKHKDCPVRYNPCTKIPLLKYKSKPTKLVEDNIIAKLLFAIDNMPRFGDDARQMEQRAYDRALMYFFLVTGSRRGGAVNLKNLGIVWDERRVEYVDKGKDYDAPLLDDLADALRDYMKVRRYPRLRRGESQADFLARIAAYNSTVPEERRYDPDRPDDFFFRDYEGYPATVNSIYSTFERWSKWVGVRLHPHQLRKYRGRTAYEQSGGDIEAVRSLMGHSTIEMTRQYLGVTTEAKHTFMRQTSPLAKFGAARRSRLG